MTSDGQSVERLREYLRTLKPEARAMLIAELERAQLRGDEMAGSELVLQELRRTIRAEAQRVPRIGDAARLFFMPFEPFLIDAPADHKRVGRIARLSLEPIWGWIGRDLIPAEAKALTEDINRALLADDKTKADQLVRALHERAILRMRETLATVGDDEKAQRRLAIQVGTPRATDDVATLLHVLEVRDVLADLAKRLPNYVRAFEREVIEQAKVHIDTACAAKSLGGDAVAQSRRHPLRSRAVDEPARGAVAAHSSRHPRRRERRCRARRRNALCGGGHDRAQRDGSHGQRAAHRVQSRQAGDVDAQGAARRRARAAHRNGFVRRVRPGAGNWPRSAAKFPTC